MTRNLRQGALDPTEAGLQAPDVETLAKAAWLAPPSFLIGVGPDGPGGGVGGQQGELLILVGPMLGADAAASFLVLVVPNVASADARTACGSVDLGRGPAGR